jgi:hypothetical protein
MSHASSRSSRPSAIAGSAARRSSADKLFRMPISKQRNKHIQQVLVEAAKLAPRYSHELALVYERERQRGNKNRATLAVARKMVAYMLCSRAQKTGLRARRGTWRHSGSVNLPGKTKHQDYSVRRLPGLADDGLSDGGNSLGSHRFVSGLAENTNSIFCTDSSESQTANGCPVLQRAGTKSREATSRNGGF